MGLEQGVAEYGPALGRWGAGTQPKHWLCSFVAPREHTRRSFTTPTLVILHHAQ